MEYVLGLICELKANSFGKVKDGIVTVIDSQQQKHRIALDSADYARAIEAHMKGLSVQIAITDANSKPLVGKDLEACPINAGLFVIDKHMERLSNEMPALVFESHEKGYGVRIVLDGFSISELGHTGYSNFLTASLYKNRRCKEPTVYMFREIRDSEELIKLGVQAQDAYLSSESYKDLVQQYKDFIKPQQVVER